eukprot:scaffold53559_cov66-Phaeocystis_antarctica.AAC.3
MGCEGPSIVELAARDGARRNLEGSSSSNGAPHLCVENTPGTPASMNAADGPRLTKAWGEIWRREEPRES